MTRSAFVSLFLLLFLAGIGNNCAAGVRLKPTPLTNAIYERQFDGYALDRLGRWPDSSRFKNTADEAVSQGFSKSRLMAGLFSALVPGGGEFYLGKKKKARFFFATEALTWMGFISFRVYANWKEDDFVEFAAVHANAQLGGKSDQFKDLVGFYDDIGQYNTEGRIIEPTRPYYPDTPEFHWFWDSPESRASYRAMKNSSRDANRNANFMIGVAVVARIISIVDAVRDATRMQRRLGSFGSTSSQSSWRLSLAPYRPRDQIRLLWYPGL